MNRTVESGLAMVIVLWVISLMTIMAGSFALSMRRETTVVSAIKDNAVSASLAEAGVAIAQQQLLLMDEDLRWVADGSVYKLIYKDAEVRVRLLAETGKIDINFADETTLSTMLASTSINPDKEQALVNAIIDWRDKDDLVRIDGAEKNEYEDAGLGYQPANNNFQLIDELLLVLGVDKIIYREIEPLITVYSRQKNINFKLASKEVLQAVSGIGTEALNEYVAQRTESHRQKIPAPDLPLGIVEQVKSSSTNKQVYTVLSQARLNADVGVVIKVTMRNTANVFEILDWQQSYQDVTLFNDESEQLLVEQ